MGINMVLFQVSSCPGNAWPSVINCQSFNTNGSLTAISGLSTNTNYMLVFDGLLNTKAKFDLTLAGSLLPVTLINFQGSISNGKASLSWTTTQEHNNSGFQVEKTTNGKDFSVIGIVAGKGNSTQRNDYRFIDPSSFGEVQQYRLRQIDQDGHFFLSQLVTLHSSPSSSGLNVVNPVGEDLKLQFGTMPHVPVELKVYDIQGRLLMTRTTEVSGTTLVVPMGQSFHAKGTYILHVRGTGLNEVRKVQAY